MKSGFWRGVVGLACIWACAVHGQEEESERSNPVRPEAGSEARKAGAADEEKSGRPPRVEVRREPIYDHRPGRNGIVDWVIIYSDGTRSTINGGATDPKADQRPGSQDDTRRNRPAPSPDEVKLKLRQYLAKAGRLVEMAQAEDKKVASLSAEQQRMDRLLLQQEQRLNEVRDQNGRISRQIPYDIPDKKRLPEPFECPNGHSYAECTHQYEKAEYARERADVINFNAAIDRQRQSRDQLQRQQDANDKQADDIQKQVSDCRQRIECIRRQKIESRQRKAEVLTQVNAIKRVIVPHLNRAGSQAK